MDPVKHSKPEVVTITKSDLLMGASNPLAFLAGVGGAFTSSPPFLCHSTHSPVYVVYVRVHPLWQVIWETIPKTFQIFPKRYTNLKWIRQSLNHHLTPASPISNCHAGYYMPTLLPRKMKSRPSFKALECTHPPLILCVSLA